MKILQAGRFRAIFVPALLTCLLIPSAGSAQDDLTKTDIPFGGAAPQVESQQIGQRILDCTVRRATNIDLAKQQTDADIIFAETSRFTLVLAPGQIPLAVGVGTINPDQAPDPGYHLAADPDGLFSMGEGGFDRVADYWPKHIEIGKTVMGKAFSFVLLNQIEGDKQHMTAFVSRAADAVTIDLTWVHRGLCAIR